MSKRWRLNSFIRIVYLNCSIMRFLLSLLYCQLYLAKALLSHTTGYRKKGVLATIHSKTFSTALFEFWFLASIYMNFNGDNLFLCTEERLNWIKLTDIPQVWCKQFKNRWKSKPVMFWLLKYWIVSFLSLISLKKVKFSSSLILKRTIILFWHFYSL